MQAVRTLHKYYELITVSLLLSVFILLCMTSSTYKSPTFDEPVHLAGGYIALTADDFRVNPENGILPQKLAALPLLFNKKIECKPQKQQSWASCNGWQISDDLIFNSGNDFTTIFFMPRMIICLIAAAGAVALYFASKEVWGIKGGLLSLFLYALSPSVIANARLVTSDITAAVFFFISTWLFWKLMRKFSFPRLIALAFAVSFLAVSKMSGIIILPVFILLAFISVMMRRPKKIEIGGKQIPVRTKGAGLLYASTLLLICAAAAFSFIWMIYGFRYSMLSDSTGRKTVDHAWSIILEKRTLPTETIAFAKDNHILPEAFLFGLGFVLKKAETRDAFLNGRYSADGWWYFFPLSFLMKTTIATILSTLSALLIPIYFRKRKKRLYLHYRHIIFPAIFIVVYFTFAIISNLNIGHRHLLPVYPPLFMIAGGAVILLRRSLPAGKIIIALICISLIADNIFIYPDYLAYFNQLSGGPANGYKHLVDSSLDWGQDLKGVKLWIEENRQNSPDVYIAYFGTVNLDAYNMHRKRLLCYFEQGNKRVFPLKGGTYCISATMLQMVYWPEFAHFGPENNALFKSYHTIFKEIYSAYQSPETLKALIEKRGRNNILKNLREYEILRFAKLCSALRKRQPDKMIGYSYLIYNLSDKEIEDILEQ